MASPAHHQLEGAPAPRAELPPSLGRGYLIALSGVVLWSWTGILISYLLRHHAIAPMALAFWRDLFATSTLLVALAWFDRAALRVERRHRALLACYGLALTFMNVTWTWSVAWNGAAVSTVLVYASPGITGLASRFLFGERLTPVRMAAFAGSMVGCVLVARANDTGQWNLNAGGILAGLLSALGFALFSLMGKAASRRRIDPWTSTLCTFAIAAMALLPISLLLAPAAGASASLFSLGASFRGWGLLLLLVVPTLGGYGLYTASLAHLPAGTANLIATLEPALTAIWAYVLLGESFDTMQLLGGALILGSVMILRVDAAQPG